MSLWFILSVIGFVSVVQIHFISVEHTKLEEKYGEERGERIGAILGMISGWGIFLFAFGIWLSPQPRFLFPLLDHVIFVIPLFGLLTLQIPVIHLIIALIFLLPGAYLGMRGVMDIGLEASETHRSAHVVTTGLYSKMRHPQYLGMILSHIGITFLVSGVLSLLITPLVIIENWILCWKEEKELVREFDEEYKEYQHSVPMFIPRLGQTNNSNNSKNM